MALWVDKYRPTSLSKLDYHKSQAEQIRNMIDCGDFPHLLFTGPSGAGKKTRVACVLRELFGPGVEKLRCEHMSFTTPSNKKLEIKTVASNYHVEITPSDCGIYDRVVIQESLKTVAQGNQLDSGSQKTFKVVVLNEVDRLTKDAQHALRRTMEKYVGSCRILLVCNSSSKVIPAIQSRCLCIRVAAPTHSEIVEILTATCKKEGLILPSGLAKRISESSGRNLRKALLLCEGCRVKQYPFSDDQQVCDPDWEVYLSDTANMIIQEQSPQRLLQIRDRLYELIKRLVPPQLIFKGLLDGLLPSCDGALKSEVVQQAAAYEHSLRLGSKEIFHLEAFVAKFMAIYKHFLEEGMLDIF